MALSFNMSFGTKTICPVCGSEFFSESKFRPKEYCSDNCKDLSKFLNAFERNLFKVNFVADYSNQMKSRIFLIANNIKCIPKKAKK